MNQETMMTRAQGEISAAIREGQQDTASTPGRPKVERVCVFQDWLFDLTMQQQSVLVLACRGPDGIAKHSPMKALVARYRACVLKAAYRGRPLRVGEGELGTFMTLAYFASEHAHEWRGIVDRFFAHVDELPHHYYMHLMHGAEIIGYKHPDPLFRLRWGAFYLHCVRDLHLQPETEEQMDARLGDWGQEHWDEPESAR